MRIVQCVLLISALLSCDRHTSEKETFPNVLLIYADDVGYGDLGCFGATKIQTPNIDRLAEQGRLFTDAHSPSSVCTPSRYGLLTGKYGWRENIWGPLPYDRPLLIDTAIMTLPRLFKRHGYSTAIIGKWHLGFGSEGLTDWNGELKPGPLDIGFDYYFGVPLVNSHAPFVFVENRYVVGLDPADPFILRQENDGASVDENLPRSPVEIFPEKYGLGRWSGADRAHQLYGDERIGTTLTQKAIEWMKNHENEKKNEPFFLYFATTNIHHPFTPHPRFTGTSQAGRYGDFIHELDWMVGELLTYIEETGIEDNTIVIFTSDNGGMLNEGGKDAWRDGHRMNGSLLGFKFGAWEGGHRVPMIVRWPGKVPPGTLSDQLIGQIDMLGTFSALLGYSLKEGEGPDSYNMLPALTGEPREPIRDHLVMAPFNPDNLAIHIGDWVYIGAQGSGGFGGTNGGPGAVAWTNEKNSDITPDGKIKKEAPLEQLYNLQNDLSQSVNVILEEPEVAEKLREKLERVKNMK